MSLLQRAYKWLTDKLQQQPEEKPEYPDLFRDIKTAERKELKKKEKRLFGKWTIFRW